MPGCHSATGYIWRKKAAPTWSGGPADLNCNSVISGSRASIPGLAIATLSKRDSCRPLPFPGLLAVNDSCLRLSHPNVYNWLSGSGKFVCEVE